jgi:hypothetical protein
MSSGSINVTSSNSSNILVSTVNPISMTDVNVDGCWMYLLMPYVEGASSNIYDITIVNPSGITIYGCILGPGGNGGFRADTASYSGGGGWACGGGGGMGGLINFTFPTSSLGGSYEFTINKVGSQSNSNISCSSLGVSVSAPYGNNGGNGSNDTYTTGKGGNGASCDSSNTTGINQSGTYYGGGGGGSGATNINSQYTVSSGGVGGSGKTLNGDSGGEGGSSDDSNVPGGYGGGTTITFSDNTTYSETGGRGGDANESGSGDGVSGPVSWAMIYYNTSSQIVTTNIGQSTSSPNITVDVYSCETIVNGLDPKRELRKIEGASHGLSVSTVNPLTYVSNGYTYIFLDCPSCSYIPSDEPEEWTSYGYACTWTVPDDGTTYYFATVGPGGPAGLTSSEQNPNNGSKYTGMSGGGGNGLFINGKLIPNYSYTYYMLDLSLIPEQPESGSTQTTSTTQNELQSITSTNTSPTKYFLNGANLPGYNSLSDDGGTISGGDGSDGCSYTSTPDENTMLTNFTCYGGGGGGGGGAAINGGSAYGGAGGNGGIGKHTGYSGTNGRIGENRESSAWPKQGGSEPGQSTYTFSDGSSTLINAGSGGYGNGSSNSDLIQATSGVPTWMMIYYQTQTST